MKLLMKEISYVTLTVTVTLIAFVLPAGDQYKTRELTPFLECVDQSPVVRSVLPKLLLQHRYGILGANCEPDDISSRP